MFGKKKEQSESENLEIIDLDEESGGTGKVLIEFKDVCKKYVQGEHEFYALKDANLTINEGEMVVILGPSGAGKSTLLNLLGGMDSASSGEIIFDGEEVDKIPACEAGTDHSVKVVMG